MCINSFSKLTSNLLLLFKLLSCNLSQVDELANLDLIYHELRVSLIQLCDRFYKLVVYTDFVLQSSTVSSVENIYLFHLVFELCLDFSHRIILIFLHSLLLSRYHLNFLVFVIKLLLKHGYSCRKLSQLILIQLALCLLPNFSKVVLPLLDHPRNLLLQFLLSGFSLFYILGGYSRVHVFGIRLSLKN